MNTKMDYFEEEQRKSAERKQILSKDGICLSKKRKRAEKIEKLKVMRTFGKV